MRACAMRACHASARGAAGLTGRRARSPAGPQAAPQTATACGAWPPRPHGRCSRWAARPRAPARRWGAPWAAHGAPRLRSGGGAQQCVRTRAIGGRGRLTAGLFGRRPGLRLNIHVESRAGVCVGAEEQLVSAHRGLDHLPAPTRMLLMLPEPGNKKICTFGLTNHVPADVASVRGPRLISSVARRAPIDAQWPLYQSMDDLEWCKAGVHLHKGLSGDGGGGGGRLPLPGDERIGTGHSRGGGAQGCRSLGATSLSFHKCCLATPPSELPDPAPTSSPRNMQARSCPGFAGGASTGRRRPQQHRRRAATPYPRLRLRAPPAGHAGARARLLHCALHPRRGCRAP
jgi:hypothetical protein